MASHAQGLGVELEAKLLQQLAVEWRGVNYSYFRGGLRVPVIRLSDGRGSELSWDGGLRSLEVPRGLVLEFAWAEVIEALKRAVVVQYVDERLGLDEGRGGETFRRICGRLGISLLPARKGHIVEDGPGPASASERVIARVHKLLALATSPNRHEAEAAAATARRLMIKFNLGQGGQGPGPDEHPDDARERARYAYRHLGPPRRYLGEHDRRLAKILNEYFFVEGAWLPVYLAREGRRATVLEICGLEPNLLMAEHVHDFVGGTAARLWRDYAAEVEGCSVHDRLAYLAGVMQGFEDKLAAQNEDLREAGLVWVPAPELGVYFRRRNPRLQVVTPGEAQRSAAYEHGSRAGRGIVLARPVTGQSRRTGGPKALGRP